MARAGLEKPDTITASAVSARDEIGRAVAPKILETKSPKEPAIVTEEVLPQIEKFLESPAEKRLPRMRNRMIVSSVGFGGAIGFSIMNMFLKEDFLVMLGGLSIITFFIWLGFVINGFLLTIPKKSLQDRSSDAKSQRDLDTAEAQTNELFLPETESIFTSVTEHHTAFAGETAPPLQLNFKISFHANQYQKTKFSFRPLRTTLRSLRLENYLTAKNAEKARRSKRKSYFFLALNSTALIRIFIKS